MPQPPTPQSPIPTAASKAVIAKLAEPRALASLNPIAARFVYSLRLIALHQRAKRDPVPELAARLHSVNVAAKSLALSQTVCAVWPEHIHVSRFCCCKLTHDEVTIATAIEAVADRDRAAFDRALEGLLRPDRIERVWDNASDLVMAELSAA
ncbi:DNA-directed RNA polymerase subunit beta' [Erythrobacter sp. SCSIO 43205]|uniref:DNA-directed RNA polymerase subunit beta' n=1 Tax=Erythrobacter sp. SCSIO 43205 TaxID=2779361 RepID=UPI001CA9DFC6|nr:DNA-directed RNA polymerase subunit beta' [Erythrobacter sp. SCSIO 43205]UAB78252.1 DNA-directed RNA polymerase subunit beta' [Erythrobacter sp. SCSIO 43205]